MKRRWGMDVTIDPGELQELSKELLYDEAGLLKLFQEVPFELRQQKLLSLVNDILVPSDVPVPRTSDHVVRLRLSGAALKRRVAALASESNGGSGHEDRLSSG
jgi:hypothetical protein